MIPANGFRSADEHRHVAPPGDYRTDDERRAAERRACPVCSAHDHTDRRPFGLDRDRQPVPAWWFTCPRCGDPDSAQAYVHQWTPAGIAHMKTTTQGAA